MGNSEITLNALPSVPNWDLTQGENWAVPFAPGETRVFRIRPNIGLEDGIYNTTITITGSDNTNTSIRLMFSVVPPQPPTILHQPSNVTLEEGTTASFSVVAIGNPEPDFQWQVSTSNGITWANALFAGSNTYAIQNVSGNLSGNLYRVAVSNINGITFSSPARLTVNRPPQIIMGGSVPLNRRDNEWQRSNIHGSAGREIRVAWTPPAGATGSVQVFAGNQAFPIITHSLATREFFFNTVPGTTYRVRFFVNTNNFFQTFTYSITSTDI
jgi:hypothetical protein